MDWSDAEGTSFLETLTDYAKNVLGQGDITEEIVISYMRKCDVHFKRSCTRISQNGAVVDPAKEEDFNELVSILIADTTTFRKFSKTCKDLSKQFPKAVPWLKWHLHPRRAQSFFPACQYFNEEEESRFSQLSSSTNAQENVGRQFQHFFPGQLSISQVLKKYLGIPEQV